MPWGPKRTLTIENKRSRASAAHFRSPLTRTIPVKTKTSSFGWKVPQVRFFPKFIFGILAHTNTEQLYNLSHMKLWMLRKKYTSTAQLFRKPIILRKKCALPHRQVCDFHFPKHMHITQTHSGARCGIFSHFFLNMMKFYGIWWNVKWTSPDSVRVHNTHHERVAV